ncbi:MULTISPECIES: FAD-binding protein [Rhodococcus]|uniref:FAD-binding protein n=1 Tax=Rhodococcus TaxID=1827 RepID=UPI0035579F74
MGAAPPIADRRDRSAWHGRRFHPGGLQTSVDSEVLHVGGDPIPGLYAAGRCTSGLSAWGYCSGISLGDGSFFGRRAGMRAAAK